MKDKKEELTDEEKEELLRSSFRMDDDHVKLDPSRPPRPLTHAERKDLERLDPVQTITEVVIPRPKHVEGAVPRLPLEERASPSEIEGKRDEVPPFKREKQ